jgi:glycosyltransferase involved in cell wall biosynthesis
MISVGFDVSGLDPTFKSHAQRGIGRYVLELKRFLEELCEPDLSVRWFDHTSLVRGGLGSRAIDCMPCGRTTLRQQLLYPLKLNSNEMKRFSFLHFPAHMDAPAWSSKPFVLTVLDLIPLILEDLYRANRPTWRFKFARWLELRAIKQALVLLAISETTARDIVRILGVPRERIVTTPLGVDQRFFGVEELRRNRSDDERLSMRLRLGIPDERPIILYVGGHDERKNISMLVEIAGNAIHQSREKMHAVPVLVLAGRIHSDAEKQRLSDALRKHDMERDTVALGYVSDEDLLSLYAESSVFLFPSLYEGFGLPVLEALAAGLPVVSSDTSSMPEVMGDCGLTFNPLSPAEGTRAVVRMLDDEGLRLHLRERGRERARGFTWQETGRKTVEAYRLAGDLLAFDRGTRRTQIDLAQGTEGANGSLQRSCKSALTGGSSR